MESWNRKFILDRIKAFYYSTEIPITVIVDDTLRENYPKEGFWGSEVLSEKLISYNGENSSIDIFTGGVRRLFKNLSKKSSCNRQVSHVTNEHGESFIVMNIDQSHFILVGPFLKKRKSEAEINKIIRENKIRINCKKMVENHYSSLPIVDAKKEFYCGRLLGIIFDVSGKAGSEYLVSGYKDTSISYEQGSLSSSSGNTDSLNRKQDFKHPPYFLEEQLTLQIKNGRMNDAMELIQEINSLKRAKLSSNKIQSIKNSLIASITIFTRAVMQGGVDPETAYNLSDYYIQKVDGFNDVYKLIDFEYTILRSFVSMVEESKGRKYPSVIKDAMTYININLTEDLSLNRISEEVHVHKNYLSSIFKKEVGITMSEYIIKKKVEEARYHVKFTDTPIVEISSFYGFCNQSYFTSVFKKYTGHTPLEFRKSR